jgi:hypothetical protein
MPDPSGDQLAPSHWATLAAAAPPAIVKLPAATRVGPSPESNAATSVIDAEKPPLTPGCDPKLGSQVGSHDAPAAIVMIIGLPTDSVSQAAREPTNV